MRSKGCIPTETIECTVDGIRFEFQQVIDAADAELARVLLGVVTLEGADGSYWVATRVVAIPGGSTS